jgi:soluble lytic murein transglycosylase-like protein
VLLEPAPERDDRTALERSPLLRALRALPGADVQEFRALRMFGRDSGNEVARWVLERAATRGLQVERTAAEALSELIGPNLWSLASEVDKLGQYAQGRPITIADVRTLTPAAREAGMFDLVDAAVEGRTPAALRLLRQMLEDGSDPPAVILVMLARQLRNLVRATELMEQRAPQNAIGEATGVTNQYALGKLVRQAGMLGRAAAEQWLADWLQLKPESLRSLPAAVTDDARFRRGTEFWRLGKLSEGKAEFQALRDAYSDNPAVLYPLAVYYRDIGLYYPSIAAAASLIRQSPAESIENAPLFLQRLVYPIYYADLIIPEAQAHNIDPMIVFSLMRAESLFDGAVTSSAAAGGLMQIIPPTGEQIARDLRWSNYQQSDLYRPIISVKFGVYYLRRYGLDYLDGDMVAAWAAYNGGPGNAQRWKEASNGDTDLFVENISLSETRLYIDRLRENLAWYQRLYGK